MRRIETRTAMNATPEEVWEVLMDFPSYPSWNPMVAGIAGEAGLGQPFRQEPRSLHSPGKSLMSRTQETV